MPETPQRGRRAIEESGLVVIWDWREQEYHFTFWGPEASEMKRRFWEKGVWWR